MNILRLILKDFRLQRGFLLPLVAIELGGLWVFLLQIPSAEIPGVAFGLLHGVMLVADFLICYRTMVAEEKNRALLLIKALPVSTREIVLAKFGVNFLGVAINTAGLLALWQGALAAGWIAFRPALTWQIAVAALTWHCLNNAFFLSIALVFDSEHAVWIPFPALFAVMSLILNFRRIKAALGLGPAVELLARNPMLLLALGWLVILALAAGSLHAVSRKRIFA
jgi:hypothetical protein